MGADIHIITQVRKDGIWNYVKELPESLNTRNYSTFGFLADVRNSFQSDGFQPKGFPEDLTTKKFDFCNYRESAKERYARQEKQMVKLPDGTYIDVRDERLKITCATEEEAQSYDKYHIVYPDQFYAYDPKVLNGEYVDITLNQLMSFEDFLAEYYEDEWDEEMQEYGMWRVDFDCPDYHSASYLSLQELLDKDLDDYTSKKAKLPAAFYRAFKELGGVMPNGMSIIEEENRIPGDLIEAFQFAFEPDIIVKWQSTAEEIAEYPIIKGIEELKAIAEKYNVEPNDIRIVFAFDN